MKKVAIFALLIFSVVFSERPVAIIGDIPKKTPNIVIIREMFNVRPDLFVDGGRIVVSVVKPQNFTAYSNIIKTYDIIKESKVNHSESYSEYSMVSDDYVVVSSTYNNETRNDVKVSRCKVVMKTFYASPSFKIGSNVDVVDLGKITKKGKVNNNVVTSTISVTDNKFVAQHNTKSTKGKVSYDTESVSTVATNDEYVSSDVEVRNYNSQKENGSNIYKEESYTFNLNGKSLYSRNEVSTHKERQERHRKGRFVTYTKYILAGTVFSLLVILPAVNSD